MVIIRGAYADLPSRICQYIHLPPNRKRIKDRQLLIRGVWKWLQQIGNRSPLLNSLVSLCKLCGSQVFGVSNGINHVEVGFIHSELH